MRAKDHSKPESPDEVTPRNSSTEWSWGSPPGQSKFIEGMNAPRSWLPPRAGEDPNTVLEQDVRDALISLLGIDGGAIEVETRDGAVTLRGGVSDTRERLACEQAVGQVHGVRSIANQLRVIPSEPERK